MSVAAAASPPERAFTWRNVLLAWRGITREQVITTFFLGCGLFLYRFVVTIDIRVAPGIFFADQLKAFVLLLAIVVVDRMTGKDPDRRGAYALAVVIAAAIAVPLTILLMVGGVLLFTNQRPQPPGGIGFALNVYFELVMVASAAMWVINDRRRAARARTWMHGAELERIAAERRSIESDLQAMQARIEPRFLLDTLAHVRRSYARDPATGEQLLDALIAYLRAAMPRMRESSSTVGNEIDLARAYLDIARLRAGGRLFFAIEPPDDGVARAAMPAMLLLPLIDRAVDAKAEAVSIRARAIAGGRVRFEILQAASALAEGDGRVAALRERLAALYGGSGSVQVTPAAAGQTLAVLELPLDG